MRQAFDVSAGTSACEKGPKPQQAMHLLHGPWLGADLMVSRTLALRVGLPLLWQSVLTRATVFGVPLSWPGELCHGILTGLKTGVHAVVALNSRPDAFTYSAAIRACEKGHNPQLALQWLHTARPSEHARRAIIRNRRSSCRR